MAKPVPVPTPETQFYWDRAKERELWLPKCGNCGRLHFSPRAFCPFCSSVDIGWIRSSGRGTVESFIINHTPGPGYAEQGPYAIAFVLLDEGIRLASNLLEVEQTPTAITIGMPVEVTFEERGEWTIPQFRPAGAAA
ncbi:MAG: Zn-ribbon OB-fold protein [Frankiales bacterium]|jgi:uncharacterized OB-fold protein|nr:Zn-ribbon OB-fold protein [Frankiales bacterium]